VSRRRRRSAPSLYGDRDDDGEEGGGRRRSVEGVRAPAGPAQWRRREIGSRAREEFGPKPPAPIFFCAVGFSKLLFKLFETKTKFESKLFEYLR
jgi:hypothetical protein